MPLLSLDRRLYDAARHLLVAAIDGADPTAEEPRETVSEQDALDAIVLLLAAIQEQVNASRIQPESGARMAALLMLIREFVRPLPPVIAADGTDLIAGDLAELAQVVRLARNRRPEPTTE
jgi:hypothetical protein